MAEKSRDYLTKNLFGPEPPRRGDKGFLEPGFRFDKEGRIVDEKGNVYDEMYNLTEAISSGAPSRGFEMAKKRHPDWSDKELAELARIYDRQLAKKTGGLKSKKEKK